jgi:formylglycine-generating enzyme required for sulfatase activity
MGNTRETDKMAFDDEMPQHRLQSAAFSVSKYPITNLQFDVFVQDGGYRTKWRSCWTEAGWLEKGRRSGPEKLGGLYDLPNHPVVNVMWYEAVAFCNWLSRQLKQSVSLPTEAQWERVARHTDGRRYPWGDDITPDHANYSETGVGATTAVGIFPKGASKCNALDMSGNIWEWCLTKWFDNYNVLPDDELADNVDRVVRGGSFSYDARLVRSAVRSSPPPSPYGRFGDLGFRVVVASP